MSEKKKGLFGRMFSANGADEEPSEAEVRRWLSEPDGRGGVRPSAYHGGGATGAGPGLGMDRSQRQAFDELAGGFSGGSTGYFPAAEEADDDAGGGVEIADVGPAGPLADAGLREGDVIVAVDGVAVDTEDDLMHALGSLMPGRSAVLEVLRGDSRMTATVVAPR
jgi:membrane-associated protease RseP (regulator of RpoE activity)